MRPDLPKKLAARIRGAQAKVLKARGWIEALEFNSTQDQARWDEYAADPEAFARKYYSGHAVDSYPVQTNTGRIREKLDDLPRKRARNQRELEEADGNLALVEAEVLAEVQAMRPTSGRVSWPAPLEPFDWFYARAVADAEAERAAAGPRREAYLAEIQRDYDEEMAAIEIERQYELEVLQDDMKTWTDADRLEFRRVMGAIAQGLRDKTLSPGDTPSTGRGRSDVRF
jgi:hypothetical protein